MAGTVWGGTTAAMLAAFALSPGLVAVLWKGFAAGAAGAAVAGERIGQTMLRRKLRQIASGEIELASLEERKEGELVVVEGIIEAEHTIRGVLTDARGVYCRMIFDPKGAKYVYEAAVDFALVDDAGHRILVEAAGARWMTPMRELVTYPRFRFDMPETPAAVKALLRQKQQIEAIEDVLAVGTRVQVVGYKTASADVTGRVVDYRLPPQRATLRSGPALPLVITAANDVRR
ncbi:MAG: hypothetical protein AB7T06_17785 [Kofleriaceae bacterium]